MIVFSSKEKIYTQKEGTAFKFAVLQRERARVERFTKMLDVEPTRKFLRSILQWENTYYSSAFLLCFVLTVWLFELWMIPLILSIILVKAALGKMISGNWEVDIQDIHEIHHEEVIK